ncbi:hypothetical protein evm_014842 [Chilo suppressalis]|nr:hypothetical protein evm_014842 [Chilo suppressalis]
MLLNLANFQSRTAHQTGRLFPVRERSAFVLDWILHVQTNHKADRSRGQQVHADGKTIVRVSWPFNEQNARFG